MSKDNFEEARIKLKLAGYMEYKDLEVGISFFARPDQKQDVETARHFNRLHKIEQYDYVYDNLTKHWIKQRVPVSILPELTETERILFIGEVR